MDQTDLIFESRQLGRPTLFRRQSPLIAALRRRAPFLVIVILPTLLASLYYAFFATPQYISEAQFVVRGQNNQSSSALAGLMAITGGANSSSEDTYAVQGFMMSRDAAQDMLKTEKLAAVYDTPVADFLARFPNFYSGRTFEDFFAYYKRHVIAELDTTTGISTLRVRSFSAADSQRVARALIVAAEALVNRMNERQRENLIASAKRERQEVIDHLNQLTAQIDSYRNKVAMIDPNKQSQPLLKDIASLQSMVLTTQLQLEQLRATAPGSPLIVVYQQRIGALTDQIAAAAKHVTGDDASLVPKISAYDDLLLKRELTVKELVATTERLDAARVQADRQQLYLDEVTQPNFADYPEYPRSLRDIVIIFVTMLGLYWMGGLIVAGAREHNLH
ncbi:Wzz/FepE/Etk N-terminal domain-containing protein [Acidomonas methanolica]|uniref:Wzz/FepE/Etk N-terminal domain-containing protein n=1 Tax=Acidomonas methanolica TaxID=437 RepID=UPI00211A295A|nr:Wzz/FepE/Etk N-terminal domain-containing protein [Acidomonas methanolica]MCQ9154526.1 capsule biosynthesis protein [Acidomonas methanolica]